jgi:hypothetical protein
MQLLLSLVGENDRPAADTNETREQFDERLDGELDGLTDEELEQAEQSEPTRTRATARNPPTTPTTGFPPRRACTVAPGVSTHRSVCGRSHCSSDDDPGLDLARTLAQRGLQARDVADPRIDLDAIDGPD